MTLTDAIAHCRLEAAMHREHGSGKREENCAKRHEEIEALLLELQARRRNEARAPEQTAQLQKLRKERAYCHTLLDEMGTPGVAWDTQDPADSGLLARLKHWHQVATKNKQILPGQIAHLDKQKIAGRVRGQNLPIITLEWNKGSISILTLEAPELEDIPTAEDLLDWVSVVKATLEHAIALHGVGTNTTCGYNKA